MSWWVSLLIWVGTTVIGELFRPKPEEPKAKSIGNFDFPSAEEGRAIPVVWGDCLIKAPNVLWYGDLTAKPIRAKTGLFQSTTIGYKYHLGIQYGICCGPDVEIVDFRFDDRIVEPITPGPFEGPDPMDISFNSPDQFGGEEQEGGIVGPMRLYFGSGNQPADEYLAAKVGTAVPGYPYLCYVMCKAMYIGTTAHLKPTAIRVRRFPNGLGLTGDKHTINGDANPACMIYEALTNTVWGLGISSGMVDIDAFRTAAEALYDEGFGLSMQRDMQSSGREAIKEICRHIDGLVFTDPTTGLETITLARFDYAIEELPILDESCISSCEIRRRGWEETANCVKVNYIDRSDDYQQKVAQAQDLASIQARGELACEPIDFLGISNGTLAQKTAARSLMTMSYPFAEGSVTVNRLAWALRPGSVFRLSWSPLGISGMVCRVNRFSGGKLLDGEIRMEIVEDIFAVAWTAYSAPPPSSWEDPVDAELGDPMEEDFHAMPYEAVRDAYEPHRLPSGMSLVARGSGSPATGHRIYVRDEADPDTWFPKDFDILTPLGYLDGDIGPLTETITVTPGIDLDRVESIIYDEFLSGANLIIISGPTAGGFDSEFVAFMEISAIEGGKFQLSTLSRGCLDTTPQSFNSGAKVWFATYGYGQASTDRPSTGSVNLRARFVLRSSYAVDDLPGSGDHLLSFYPGPSVYTQREDLPYCPTNVEMNDASYPESISGELTVSWNHRNRLGVWNYGDSGVTEDLESGTSYVLRIYGELGTLVHEEVGLTGTSYTYPEALEISESGLGRLNNELRVVLFSIIGDAGSDPDGVENSFQKFDWSFDRVE